MDKNGRLEIGLYFARTSGSNVGFFEEWFDDSSFPFTWNMAGLQRVVYDSGDEWTNSAEVRLHQNCGDWVQDTSGRQFVFLRMSSEKPVERLH